MEKEIKEKSSVMASLLEKEKFSPKVLKRGEVVEGEIIAVKDKEVLLDVGSKAEGYIPVKEFEEEGYKREDIKPGDKILAAVIYPEAEYGMSLLSIKKASSERRWRQIQEAYNNGSSLEVKPLETVRSGLMVELDSLKGFVPSSHLTGEASEILKKGQPLKVKVLEFDKKTSRLIFSAREELLNVRTGEILEGEVTKIFSYGIYFKAKQGEGLIHISEISWERIENLGNLFKVGEKIKAKVIGVDQKEGKLSLSIKQLTKDPWEGIEEKYSVGKKVEGVVSRSTPYGVFVRLDEGIEGLVHSSKIPYGVEFKEGDKFEGEVDILVKEERKLGLKLAQ